MSFIHPNVCGDLGGAGMQSTSIISLGPVSLTHSIQWVQLGINVCSVVSDSATPWTVALRAPPLSTGLFRQEYWRGLPFHPPGCLPAPGTEPVSPALQGRFFTRWVTGEAHRHKYLRLLYSLYLFLSISSIIFSLVHLGLLLSLFCITGDWPLKTVSEAVLPVGFYVSLINRWGVCTSGNLEAWRRETVRNTQSHRDPNILCLPGFRILFILLP